MNLAGAQLPDADLTGSDLTHTDFMNIEAFGPKHFVLGIDLSYAHLDYANLSKVLDVGGRFKQASMFCANLSHSSLLAADWRAPDE